MEVISSLKKESAQINDLKNIMSLLQWDQEVMIPARAAKMRASQFATLSGIIHRKEIAPQIGELLQEAEEKLDEFSDEDQGLVRVMRRSYDENTKLPEEFVTDYSKLTSQALQTWIEARQKANFSLFAPVLQKVVSMCLQKADYLGYEKEPYDALLDLHEEGLTTATVDAMFADLREPLIAMVNHAGQKSDKGLTVTPPFDLAVQQEFADQVLAQIGFDFERGRQDKSTHPFTTSLGHHDRRVTNRYKEDSVEFIFSALHEGGHALYEQGIDEKIARSHLDTGISLGIHESQSRLWENIIGRSLPFWENFYPKLQKAFPEQFKNMLVSDFLKAINVVQPGMIRVEADEVTYNLHVLIRFEIERDLFRDLLNVKDLPRVWNEKYKDYLGVDVDSDANGVLQDIHWSHGSFGYFPTYSIGNLASAQIWAAYRRYDAHAESTIRSGNLQKIRLWLTEQIYRHGSVYPPSVLLQKVTGEKLNSAYFKEYLQEKYR
ncbi:MAG: carboxypeptidase M32 [Desulfobulbaceae bacterium]|nr:carboxypeptidase M32 [Desulfobulbaceae bacterium]